MYICIYICGESHRDGTGEPIGPIEGVWQVSDDIQTEVLKEGSFSTMSVQF